MSQSERDDDRLRESEDFGEQYGLDGNAITNLQRLMDAAYELGRGDEREDWREASNSGVVEAQGYKWFRGAVERMHKFHVLQHRHEAAMSLEWVILRLDRDETLLRTKAAEKEVASLRKYVTTLEDSVEPEAKEEK